MKQINTIFRTLCLTAMLCMTSVNAMAYQFLSGDATEIVYGVGHDWGDSNILVVDGGQYALEKIRALGDKPIAIVITKGTTVSVSDVFHNSDISTIYVFGTLILGESCSTLRNDGNIYVMGGGSLIGQITADTGNIKYECSISDILSSHEVKGKAPAIIHGSFEDGWKDFYVKDAVICENDYYPILGTTTYYTDATMENPIEDLEAWKQGEGKLISSIDSYKTDAINAINEVREGLSYIESYNSRVEEYIAQIEGINLGSYNIIEAVYKIDALKNEAFRAIEEWLSVIKARNGAIKEINDAINDVIVYYPDCEKEVEGYISSINKTESYDIINNQKKEALAAIEKIRKIANSTYKYFVGTMGTPQNGPAVIVTDKDDKEIILYSPKSVEYIKVKEE